MNASGSDPDTLEQIVDHLRGSVAVQDKADIRDAYAPALTTHGQDIRNGDDCAAIPDGAGGYLLLAGEAMLQQFVAEDPWFAGYSALMVNISDICAMGGTPTAVVDMLWSPDLGEIAPVWEGMRAAAEAYGVPIVGGHTTITRSDQPVYLAASILGSARTLMTSFDAEPGDVLLMAVDLDGAYRGDRPFWNASTDAAPERLRELNALLPEISEAGWCHACKDISNGGVIGTLIMLLQCSGVGASLRLDALPRPPGVGLKKWLLSFPSYGFLFSASPENAGPLKDYFDDRRIACEGVGEITAEPELALSLDGAGCVFWSQQEGIC